MYLMDIKKNKKNTINQKFSMLKRYMKFLVDKGYMEEGELTKLSRIKYRKMSRVPLFYDYSILKRIYLVLDNSSLLTETEKLFLFFILNHGATYKELLSIKFTDIDWEGSHIYINDGFRVRHLFLGKQELIYLTRYIQFKKGNIHLDKSLLLFQNKGIPMTEYEIKKAIKKISKILGQKLCLRGLRNTFIMYAIDLGADIIYIKEYLGLKSFSSLSKFEYINKKHFDYSLKHINFIREKISIKTKKTENKLNENLIRIFDKIDTVYKTSLSDKIKENQ